MPHSLKPIRRIATVTIALGLAALVLAACGSSSSSTTSSASASANGGATNTTPGGAPPQGGRFAALRQCLQKAGINLPQRKPGSGGGFLGGPGGQLPSGVSRSQLEAAIKKCGGTPNRGLGGGGLGGAKLSTPAAQAALATFAGCMRQHGVNLPAPNTTGKGPVFNTSGLNTASSQFKSAQSTCLPALRSAVGARPGGAGGAPPQAP